MSDDHSGALTYSEIVSALRDVKDWCGRDIAVGIIKSYGVNSVRDLKPGIYGEVLGACTRAVRWQLVVNGRDTIRFEKAVDKWFSVCNDELAYRHPELMEGP